MLLSLPLNNWHYGQCVFSILDWLSNNRFSCVINEHLSQRQLGCAMTKNTFGVHLTLAVILNRGYSLVNRTNCIYLLVRFSFCLILWISCFTSIDRIGFGSTVSSFKLKLYTILLTASVVDFTVSINRAVFPPKSLCKKRMCVYPRMT